jgi:thermostable 8-oxoguanine DNA glycosylase|tara:strand:- start:455 stop:1036 length:582 start_codon:yes stop_codon:yes gene_type:complete
MNGINPQKITDFNRTKAELELFAVFAVCVAGKRAKVMAKKVNDCFLECWTPTARLSPFEMIKSLLDIRIFGAYLQSNRFGQYKRLWRALKELSDLDVATCSREDLEKVHGIGPKTSRFFLMHSRPNQQFATLDTHVLKWLRSKGVDAPKDTPQSKKVYAKLERKFLQLCKDERKLPADMDLKIWKCYACSSIL